MVKLNYLHEPGVLHNLEQRQGLTLVHIRAQLEQLQDTFMSQVWFNGGQKSSS